MPITPFLPKQQVYEPQLTETMSAAFVRACSTFGLADRTDPMREIVARKIIEAAQSGLRTQVALYMSAIQELSPTTISEGARASDHL
jgi:hypothetical protein